MSIECSFGRLKARWRVLLRKPDVHISTMRNIIYVCFLLHNFCEFNNQGVLERWVLDSQTEESHMSEQQEQEVAENGVADVNVHESNVVAKQIRADLARRLYNDCLTVQ